MSSQFKLLGERRFAGLFYTQFFGALNDNVFKAALSLIFVYHGLVATESIDMFVNLAAGLFILPYFLFSATAGQIADKYEKSQLVRIIKLVEIAVAFSAALAIYSQSVAAMLLVLFLLGVQSTFFGPLKFSILPQQLDESELVGGNAQIEMGTFVAILVGTIAPPRPGHYDYSPRTSAQGRLRSACRSTEPSTLGLTPAAKACSTSSSAFSS